MRGRVSASLLAALVGLSFFLLAVAAQLSLYESALRGSLSRARIVEGPGGLVVTVPSPGGGASVGVSCPGAAPVETGGGEVVYLCRGCPVEVWASGPFGVPRVEASLSCPVS